MPRRPCPFHHVDRWRLERIRTGGDGKIERPNALVPVRRRKTHEGNPLAVQRQRVCLAEHLVQLGNGEIFAGANRLLQLAVHLELRPTAQGFVLQVINQLNERGDLLFLGMLGFKIPHQTNTD